MKKLLKLIVPVALLCAGLAGPAASTASACPKFCNFLCMQGSHCCKLANGCAACCPN
ncbi:MAG: hypothetical protein M3O15_04795 [Acidobacteriota bacterium]|nr:hypothetical protein [Acidobacteriota bacterium]